MDITTITAAYAGLKAAKDIFAGLTDLKVETATLEKINDAVRKVGEAQDALFSMREELFRLQEDNNSLKAKIAEMESWDSKLSRYDLIKTAGGAVVYNFSGEPNHYVCPSCVAKHELHILQHNGSKYSSKQECPNCKTRYAVENEKPMPPINRGRGFV